MLEKARKEKKIGHSLDAAVTIGLPSEQLVFFGAYSAQLKFIFIVSSVELKETEEVSGGEESEEYPGFRCVVTPSQKPRCERCWVHDETAGQAAEAPGLCRRCREALEEIGRSPR